MKHRRKLSRKENKKKFTNAALATKNVNLSAKPRRGGIRM